MLPKQKKKANCSTHCLFMYVSVVTPPPLKWSAIFWPKFELLNNFGQNFLGHFFFYYWPIKPSSNIHPWVYSLPQTARLFTTQPKIWQNLVRRIFKVHAHCVAVHDFPFPKVELSTAGISRAVCGQALELENKVTHREKMLPNSLWNTCLRAVWSSG